MQVLVVTPWFPSDKNPVSGIFHLRDVELLALDNTLLVVHLDESSSHIVETQLVGTGGRLIRVMRVPYSLWSPLKVIRARKILRGLLGQMELLHTMSGPALIPFFGIKVPAKWIHTEHWSAFTRPPLTWREKISLDVIKVLYTRPQIVVAVSNFLANHLRILRQSRVEVIGNFVGTFDMSHYQRKPDQPLKIIGVGSVIEQKGPHLAVEAVDYLNKKGIDAELLWLGGGPLVDECLKLAAGLGITDKVTFGGNVPNEVVNRELSQSDLFIAPTRLETFGVAIGEAMASGLPVVTGDCGGFLDFIQPASSRIVTTRTGAAFGEAILDLVNAPDLPSREIIANFAQAQFDESLRRTRYQNLYSSIMQT